MIGFAQSLLDWARLHPPTGPLSAWLKALAVLVGAGWALLTFSRNNRIKAAELLLNLEQECRAHIDTLLKIDYLPDYSRYYADALKKSVPRGEQYSPDE